MPPSSEAKCCSASVSAEARREACEEFIPLLMAVPMACLGFSAFERKSPKDWPESRWNSFANLGSETKPGRLRSLARAQLKIAPPEELLLACAQDATLSAAELDEPDGVNWALLPPP